MKIPVERRFDTRHPTDMDLRVTRLTQPALTGEGQVVDISKSGVCVMAPFELVIGDIVQLQIADSTLFGFVVYANLEGEATRAGIEVQRVLMGGTDLSKILRRVLQQALPEVPGVLTGSFTT